jgi:hypothetical protein
MQIWFIMRIGVAGATGFIDRKLFRDETSGEAFDRSAASALKIDSAGLVLSRLV